MKKIYQVSLYQVNPMIGYLCSGFEMTEKYRRNIFYREKNETKRATIPVTLYQKNLLVEKVSRNRVREIKTGITFPIVYEYMPNNSTIILGCQNKVHTHIYFNELSSIEKNPQPSTILSEYDKLHPDVAAFKEELLRILKTGQINMEAKLYCENLNDNLKRERELRQVLSDRFISMEAKEERIKTRRLIRKFANDRKK